MGGVNRYMTGSYIYLGEWLGIWGHCITDNLKKLWAVDYFKNSSANKDYKLCVAKPFKGDYPNNFKLILAKIGIDFNEILFIDQPTSIENLVIPDDSIVVKGDSRYYYKEYSDIIDRIRKSIPVLNDSPDKIYFTRTRIRKNKKDFGEKMIEDVFRKLGFAVYSPEELSLDEQLSLLRNCKYFACTEGSIAHNVIFCNDGVNIVIIRKICGLISYQFTLMDVRKANVTYIDSGLTLFYVFAFWSGPFLLCVRDNLIEYAKNFGGLELYPKVSKRSLLGYFIRLVLNSLRARVKPTKCKNFSYYKTIFSKIVWKNGR